MPGASWNDAEPPSRSDSFTWLPKVRLRRKKRSRGPPPGPGPLPAVSHETTYVDKAGGPGGLTARPSTPSGVSHFERIEVAKTFEARTPGLAAAQEARTTTRW